MHGAVAVGVLGALPLAEVVDAEVGEQLGELAGAQVGARVPLRRLVWTTIQVSELRAVSFRTGPL